MTVLVRETPTILVVDDVPDNLVILTALLQDHYRVLSASTGHGALEMAHKVPPPDLILLDVVMEDLDGFEVCRRLKADPVTEEIPVIFLTSQSESQDEQTGLDLGAVDYLTKPFSPPLVLARIKTQLKLKASQDFLKDKNSFLEQEVARRTKEIATIQEVTMVAFGSLAETRDNETGAHIRRTQHFMRLLATEAGALVEFRRLLTEETIALLFQSAPLHDIGKVGIPDHILLKPGRLNSQEFEVMKTHTTLGVLAIQAAERRLGSPVTFLRCAREIAGTHHERWDGTGYPSGLAGDDIPLSGRLMAVADVYDALRSERVYKPAYSHEKAVELMKEGSKGHFDPRLLKIFCESSEIWKETFDRSERL